MKMTEITKKLLALGLLCTVMLTSVGCGDNNTSSSKTDSESAITTTLESESKATLVDEEASEENQETILPPEVKEYGFSMEDEYLYFSIIYYNPNEDIAIEYPSFRITARNSEGEVIASEEEVESIIYPQQESACAGMAFKVDELPASLDVEALEPEDYSITKVEMLENPEYAPLTAFNVTMREENIVGEIQNENDYDIESAIVTVVFRDEDGKLIGGDFSFVDSLKANSATPFDVSIDLDFATTNYEIYANIW
ncbi:MAG: FxLYD domain-containing protein [Ruminococcus sp.]|nr:FxLYD domain-containing protein [Ruminococcus sp.]